MAESHSGGSEELLGSKVAGKRTESAGSMKKGRNSRRLHGRCRTHRKMSEQHPKPQHFLKESLIYEIYPQKFESNRKKSGRKAKKRQDRVQLRGNKANRKRKSKISERTVILTGGMPNQMLKSVSNGSPSGNFLE